MSDTLILKRQSADDKQTLGVIEHRGFVIAHTLELPWRDNERNESCIPTGKYEVVKHMSPKFGQCFWLQGTAPRTQILIHAGNYHGDTSGCILVGSGYIDLDNDGYNDLIKSKDTLEKMLFQLGRKFTLEVIDETNGIT